MKYLSKALTICIALSLPMSSFAYTESASNDSTAAVKLTQKAIKLINSDNPKDHTKAVELYEKAAEMGLKSAQEWMSEHCAWVKDYTNYAKWEEKLADGGDINHMYICGNLYIDFAQKKYVEQNYAKGAYYLRKAAEQSHAPAQYQYACCYINGYGVDIDSVEAFKWFKKSSDNGFFPATADLGKCYLHGMGCEVDETKALECFNICANKGDAQSQFVLGVYYQTGVCVEKNLDTSIMWYRKAAAQGLEDAKYNLIDAMIEKDGWTEEAISQLRVLAEKGNIDAQLDLGNLYGDAESDHQDFKEGFKWFLMAAEQGHAEAQQIIGDAYRRGCGVDEDPQKSFMWFEKAALQKDTLSIFTLGIYYMEAYGVEQDEPKGFKFLKEAAEMGYPAAVYTVAQCYYEGRGVEKDLTQWMKWIKTGCEIGEPESFFELGAAYFNGEGVEQNYDSAISCFQKYIENGGDNIGFCYAWLGRCYATKEDYKTAFEYYKKAADAGNCEGMFQLAGCYIDGVGVGANIAKGKELLKKCAAQDENEEIKGIAKSILEDM